MSVQKTVCTLVFAAVFAFGAPSFGADEAPAGSKPNEARLKGMKAAIVDIENGVLMQKYPPYPDAPQHGEYVGVLARKYGVAAQVVECKNKSEQDELHGYNDVMRVEIEHRFGRGLLDKLWKQTWKGAEPSPTLGS